MWSMKYYSAIEKIKIMPSAATWMELEIIILSEVRKRKTNTILLPALLAARQANESETRC